MEMIITKIADDAISESVTSYPATARPDCISTTLAEAGKQFCAKKFPKFSVAAESPLTFSSSLYDNLPPLEASAAAHVIGRISGRINCT